MRRLSLATLATLAAALSSPLAACGPKKPAGPPIPARFCEQGMGLHGALALEATATRSDVVVVGPNPTVHPADGPLRPAIAAARDGAGMSEVHLPGGGRLVSPGAPAPVVDLDLGERRVNLELVHIELRELARLLAQVSGKQIVVEGGEQRVTVVLHDVTAGAALARVAAAGQLQVRADGPVWRVTPGATSPEIERPDEAVWGAPFVLTALTGGDTPRAWVAGPSGFPVGLVAQARAPMPVGIVTVIGAEAATFVRDDHPPTVLALCDVVPRGLGAWRAIPLPSMSQVFPRQVPDDYLWTLLEGPLDGRDRAELALLFVAGGPRAEVRAALDRFEAKGTPLPWAVERVEAVFLADADADGGEELLVVGDWTTGVGPQGVVPFPATLVIDVGRDGLTVEARDDLTPARTAEALGAVLGAPVRLAPGAVGPRARPEGDAAGP